LKFRVGQGFDFHPLRAGRPLILAGVNVPFALGLSGHSDADVAAHALANGILGALGEGDLGRHFSDQDPRYQGADSIELLKQVWLLAYERGWQLGNADLTIFAQAPRLAPYIPAMRARLASALEVEPTLINIKVSNPEAMGALGRGEGMAAAAAVLLKAP
jgi:2-C-methyl-D-erythritol 2,4-cyclodiphosphate synthase